MGILNRLISNFRPTKSDNSYEFDHYTDSIETIKKLRREEKHNEALDLLKWCMNQTEAEDNHTGGVAPWYYEQAAIIYRKEKQYDKEVKVLERFEKQNHARGATPKKLIKRLERARELNNK